MVFSSPIFLFIFLPVFFSTYYVAFFSGQISHNLFIKKFLLSVSNTFLLLSSLLFYFWGEGWLVLIMLTSTVVDYVCGLAIGASKSEKKRKLFLFLSLAINLSLLGFFKYFNFGLENLNSLIGLSGLSELQIHSVAEVTLPLGISFYTFQSMSYTIDVYRGDTKPTANFFGFACFVTMFPQLVAGPIVRYRDIASQIFSRTITQEQFSSGCLRFIIGLGKKVLLANTVAVAADHIFAIPGDKLTPDLAWLGIICYTLQIFFDFSGYSDMAIGLGRMLGFHFPENFNYPYFARSIQDFWRRWHISLSSWFRDYLYFPLGGNRCSTKRNYFNLLAVFFLCGLWHGASWTFVVWGVFHGVFLVIEKHGFAEWLIKRPRIIGNFYSIIIVMFGWVLFRSETFEQVIKYYCAMAGVSTGDGLEYNVAMYLGNDLKCALICGSLFSLPVIPWFVKWFNKTVNKFSTPMNQIIQTTYSAMKIVLLLGVGFLSVVSISSGAYNPFIYFRF